MFMYHIYEYKKLQCHDDLVIWEVHHSLWNFANKEAINDIVFSILFHIPLWVLFVPKLFLISILWLLLSPSTATNEIEDLHQADKAEAQEEPKQPTNCANKTNLCYLLLGQVLADVGVPDVDIHLDHVQFCIPKTNMKITLTVNVLQWMFYRETSWNIFCVNSLLNSGFLFKKSSHVKFRLV